MSDLTIGLLSALLATNQPQAVSNLVQQQTGLSVPLVEVNDPVEKQLRDLMIADDDAMAEVNDWISTNTIARTNTPALTAFNQRISARFDVVKHGYDSFLRNHPDSARGFLAYGSFLNDIGDEDGAHVQYENSKQLDPTEPVYYQNFATTVYLYRKDAREFYGINEQQVFDKALGLYRQAMKLAPDNLVLATDYAESYYGIRPLRTNDALAAWTNCLNLAKDDNEREGVLIHLARVKISAGFYDEAQAQLDAVTNRAFADMRTRLIRSLNDHKNPPTNSVPEITTNIAVIKINSVPASTNGVPTVPNYSDLQAAPPNLRGQKR